VAKNGLEGVELLQLDVLELESGPWFIISSSQLLTNKISNQHFNYKVFKWMLTEKGCTGGRVNFLSRRPRFGFGEVEAIGRGELLKRGTDISPVLN